MSKLRLVATLYGHTDVTWSAAWSPRGLLATCGADCSVRIWHSTKEGWKIVTILSDKTFLRTVRDVTWSTDGRSLAAASFDGTATILELLGGETPKLDPAVCLEGHDSEVKGVAYSSSGGLLSTCSRDRSVWIWEVGLDFEYDCIAVLNGHSGDVKSVKWHPEVEMLASCSYDDTIRIWVEDADDWFCCETLGAHSGTVWGLAFEKRGNGLASVGGDGAMVVWRREDPPANVSGGVPRFKVAGRVEDLHAGEPVYSVDWNVNGLIATVGGDDCIRILEKRTTDESDTKQDVAEGGSDSGETTEKPVKSRLSERWDVVTTKIRAHSGDVNHVTWNPMNPNMLATCGDDGLVRIWELAEEDVTQSEERPEGTVT